MLCPIAQECGEREMQISGSLNKRLLNTPIHFPVCRAATLILHRHPTQHSNSQPTKEAADVRSVFSTNFDMHSPLSIAEETYDAEQRARFTRVSRLHLVAGGSDAFSSSPLNLCFIVFMGIQTIAYGAVGVE
jgi:hypothetical protein